MHPMHSDLCRLLRSRGLKVFFDRDYLTPGQAWPTLLEKHLRACRAVAICLGPEGLGPWQQREQYVALDRQAQQDHFPVIPLLLPGAKDPPLGFLRLSTWIDLKAGVEDWPALNILERAIRGQAPSPDDTGLPDRARLRLSLTGGWSPFAKRTRHFFVGREAFIRTLLDKDRPTAPGRRRGGIGLGKKLSCISWTRAFAASARRWPGLGDSGRCARGPTRCANSPPFSCRRIPTSRNSTGLQVLKKRAEQLASGEITLADVIDTALERQPGTDRLLLVVDQWEELYTQARDLPLKDSQDAKDKLR